MNTMYGYYNTFELRAMQANNTPSKTRSNNPSGPRDIIETLTEILHIFSVIITEENEFTPTPEFQAFLDSQLVWIASIDEDLRLYDFRNKSHITELKTFLTYPHPQFKGCIKYMDELMDIADTFRHAHDQHGARVLNTLPRNKYLSLQKQFAGISTRLGYILDRTPPADYATMHENNRQLYYELNKYILNPVRIEKMADHYGIEFIDYLDSIMGMDE